MALNLANKITIGRLLLVPVFAALILSYRELQNQGAEYLRFLALAVFIVAAISDAVDGFIARNFNQKTRLGSFLDPIADKLLLVTAITLLSLRIPGIEKLPSWFPVLVVSRDFFLVIGAFVIYYTAGTIKVVPNFLGKSTTVFQMMTVVWTLLKLPLLHWIWGIAAALTLLSGLVYLYNGTKQLNGNH